MNNENFPSWVKDIWKELTTLPSFLNQPIAKPENKTAESKISPNEEPNSPLRQSVYSYSPYETTEADEEAEEPAQSLDDLRVLFRANGFHPRVLDQYSFDIYKAIPYRSVMLLQTANGTIALKRAHAKKKRLQFMYEALQFAERSRFTKYNQILPTIRNSPFFQTGDDVYYASRWINGQAADLSSIAQVGSAARTIAEFHLATRGFESDRYAPPGAFDLEKKLKSRIQELDNILAKVRGKRKLDPVDRYVLKHLPLYKKQAQQAANLLEDPRCRDFLAQDETNPGLCHLDITPENLVYTPRHGMYLIDFDLMSYGPRMLDIAHLIRRSLQATDWQRETALVPLVQVNSVEPLRHAEYRILQAILTFPHSFWRAIHTHYAIRSTPYTLARLQRLYEQEEDRQYFLTDLGRHIDRHRGI